RWSRSRMQARQHKSRVEVLLYLAEARSQQTLSNAKVSDGWSSNHSRIGKRQRATVLLGPVSYSCHALGCTLAASKKNISRVGGWHNRKDWPPKSAPIPKSLAAPVMSNGTHADTFRRHSRLQISCLVKNNSRHCR